MVLLRHISIALTAAVAALGSALFIALNLFYKRRIWSPHAEYCTIREEEEERGKRQVLVLGLDGAGKSSMLQGLTPGESAAKRGRCRPTRGFNFMSLNVPACQLDFLEMQTEANDSLSVSAHPVRMAQRPVAVNVGAFVSVTLMQRHVDSSVNIRSCTSYRD